MLGAMRKLNVVGLMLVAAFGLTSCTAASPAAQALELCKESAEKQLPGQDVDFGGLKAENMSQTLFDAGITDKVDESDVLYTVAGEFTATEGSVTKRYNVLCMATEAEGEVTMKNTATVTGG